MVKISFTNLLEIIGMKIHLYEKILLMMKVIFRDSWNLRHYRIGSEFENLMRKSMKNATLKCTPMAPSFHGVPWLHIGIQISGANDNHN